MGDDAAYGHYSSIGNNVKKSSSEVTTSVPVLLSPVRESVSGESTKNTVMAMVLSGDDHHHNLDTPTMEMAEDMLPKSSTVIESAAENENNPFMLVDETSGDRMVVLDDAFDNESNDDSIEIVKNKDNFNRTSSPLSQLRIPVVPDNNGDTVITSNKNDDNISDVILQNKDHSSGNILKEGINKGDAIENSKNNMKIPTDSVDLGETSDKTERSYNSQKRLNDDTVIANIKQEDIEMVDVSRNAVMSDGNDYFAHSTSLPLNVIKLEDDSIKEEDIKDSSIPDASPTQLSNNNNVQVPPVNDANACLISEKECTVNDSDTKSSTKSFIAIPSMMNLQKVDNSNVWLTSNVADEIINEIILGFCFEMHRLAKIGALFLMDTDVESESQFSIHDTDISFDIFGKILSPLVKMDCPCPNCSRQMAASRLAPHLEKCMGMGRNSFRMASRRIASSVKHVESDNESDNGNEDSNHGDSNNLYHPSSLSSTSVTNNLGVGGNDYSSISSLGGPRSHMNRHGSSNYSSNRTASPNDLSSSERYSVSSSRGRKKDYYGSSSSYQNRNGGGITHHYHHHHHNSNSAQLKKGSKNRGGRSSPYITHSSGDYSADTHGNSALSSGKSNSQSNNSHRPVTMATITRKSVDERRMFFSRYCGVPLNDTTVNPTGYAMTTRHATNTIRLCERTVRCSKHSDEAREEIRQNFLLSMRTSTIPPLPPAPSGSSTTTVYGGDDVQTIRSSNDISHDGQRHISSLRSSHDDNSHSNNQTTTSTSRQSSYESNGNRHDERSRHHVVSQSSTFSSSASRRDDGDRGETTDHHHHQGTAFSSRSLLEDLFSANDLGRATNTSPKIMQSHSYSAVPGANSRKRRNHHNSSANKNSSNSFSSKLASRNISTSRSTSFSGGSNISSMNSIGGGGSSLAILTGTSHHLSGIDGGGGKQVLSTSDSSAAAIISAVPSGGGGGFHHSTGGVFPSRAGGMASAASLNVGTIQRIPRGVINIGNLPSSLANSAIIRCMPTASGQQIIVNNNNSNISIGSNNNNNVITAAASNSVNNNSSNNSAASSLLRVPSPIIAAATPPITSQRRRRPSPILVSPNTATIIQQGSSSSSSTSSRRRPITPTIVTTAIKGGHHHISPTKIITVNTTLLGGSNGDNGKDNNTGRSFTKSPSPSLLGRKMIINNNSNNRISPTKVFIATATTTAGDSSVIRSEGGANDGVTTKAIDGSGENSDTNSILISTSPRLIGKISSASNMRRGTSSSSDSLQDIAKNFSNTKTVKFITANNTASSVTRPVSLSPISISISKSSRNSSISYNNNNNIAATAIRRNNSASSMRMLSSSSSPNSGDTVEPPASSSPSSLELPPHSMTITGRRRSISPRSTTRMNNNDNSAKSMATESVASSISSFTSTSTTVVPLRQQLSTIVVSASRYQPTVVLSPLTSPTTETSLNNDGGSNGENDKHKVGSAFDGADDKTRSRCDVKAINTTSMITSSRIKDDDGNDGLHIHRDNVSVSCRHGDNEKIASDNNNDNVSSSSRRYHGDKEMNSSSRSHDDVVVKPVPVSLIEVPNSDPTIDNEKDS